MPEAAAPVAMEKAANNLSSSPLNTTMANFFLSLFMGLILVMLSFLRDVLRALSLIEVEPREIFLLTNFRIEQGIEEEFVGPVRLCSVLAAYSDEDDVAFLVGCINNSGLAGYDILSE